MFSFLLLSAIIRDTVTTALPATSGTSLASTVQPFPSTPFSPENYTCIQSELPDICMREGLQPYTNFMFPNRYSKTTEDAGEIFSVFLRPVLNCPQLDATIWLCLALFPACPFSEGKPMCREFCEGIENSCDGYFEGNLVDLVDCSIYPESGCVTFGGSKYSIWPNLFYSRKIGSFIKCPL